MTPRRKKKIEAGLADCFVLIANAMKAGLGLQQALKLAGEEGPWPLNEEFSLVLEKTKLGHTLDEALSDTERKLNIPDFSLMVHSVILLRGIGGNLASHLENLSKILRERQKVTAKVGLLTAQGMTQGVILAVMPFVLGLVLHFLSPDFIAPLFAHPLGWLSLAAVVILDCGGYFWMRHMAKVTI
ncbi:MAG: type II secretion system F family protein [Deltaproteobacteria bacterium]|nr:type II secretion system F family protein [Deltaproteobacteria bacterium]